VNLEREHYKVRTRRRRRRSFSVFLLLPLLRSLFFFFSKASQKNAPPLPLLFPTNNPNAGPRLRRRPFNGGRHGPPLVGELLRLRVQGRLRVPRVEGRNSPPDAVLARRPRARDRPLGLGALLLGGAGLRIGAGGAGGARVGGRGDAGGGRDVRGELREVRVSSCFFSSSFSSSKVSREVSRGKKKRRNSKNSKTPFLSLFFSFSLETLSQVRRHRVRRDGPGSVGHGELVRFFQIIFLPIFSLSLSFVSLPSSPDETLSVNNKKNTHPPLSSHLNRAKSARPSSSTSTPSASRTSLCPPGPPSSSPTRWPSRRRQRRPTPATTSASSSAASPLPPWASLSAWLPERR